jgi:hypothetical protein
MNHHATKNDFDIFLGLGPLSSMQLRRTISLDTYLGVAKIRSLSLKCSH